MMSYLLIGIVPLGFLCSQSGTDGVRQDVWGRSGSMRVCEAVWVESGVRMEALREQREGEWMMEGRGMCGSAALSSANLTGEVDEYNIYTLI